MAPSIAILYVELCSRFKRHIEMKSSGYFRTESEAPLAFPLLGCQAVTMKSCMESQASIILPKRWLPALMCPVTSCYFLQDVVRATDQGSRTIDIASLPKIPNCRMRPKTGWG